MARAATTSDVFNAVAEATRRQLLDALAEGEATVTQLVERLELGQPQVSKHLKVLTEVGLVDVRADGRHRHYRLRAAALAPLQRWLAPYEQLINARYDRLDTYLAELQRDPNTNAPNHNDTPDNDTPDNDTPDNDTPDNDTPDNDT